MDPSIQPPREPNYSLYQKECFLLSQKGSHPDFSTRPDKLEALAKECLTQGGWLYASCNAGLGWTDRANREGSWKILPRMAVDTSDRDTTTELFGHRINAPVCFAPIGINKIYHPVGTVALSKLTPQQGELNAAKVAGELNIPYCLSTAGSQPIEDVGRVNGSGPRFFQLYCPHDVELEDSLLQRAWVGIGAEIGLTDPVFRKRLQEAGLDPNNPDDMPKIGEKWIDNVWHDDARKAVKVGCDGIVVSNHAGRQVDGAVGSLEVLPELTAAVGDQCTVLFDSGIRSAADIFKAVLVGRLYGKITSPTPLTRVFGMAIAGEAGVRHVMKSLLAEFDILMNCAGVKTVADIKPSHLRECSPVHAHR
ncbi:hypothetical protein IAU60_004916 [Kwoniella sp. DSM 27419]